jgi:hypothetical protein
MLSIFYVMYTFLEQRSICEISNNIQFESHVIMARYRPEWNYMNNFWCRLQNAKFNQNQVRSSFGSKYEDW